MHQTLITDRGRPKNRYPYILSVRVSCAKPVGLRIVSLQSCNQLACLQLIPTLQFLTYSIIFAASPTDTPTDTNRYPKAMTNLLGKPSGHNSFGLHHENPYLRPFFCQHQMDQVYVCLVSLSMHFIHVVCLTVSPFLFPLPKLMGKCSKASKEEQCGIPRLRSKMQAASRRCRHSTNKCFQKSKHNWSQLDRRRRRAQHRQRMLANKIATYNQDDDANSSSASSSSSTSE